MLTLSTVSCVKEKREVTYTNQESKIDQYISSKSIVKNGDVTDTLRVEYRGGASRLVLQEGAGEELKKGGILLCRTHLLIRKNHIQSLCNQP